MLTTFDLLFNRYIIEGNGYLVCVVSSVSQSASQSAELTFPSHAVPFHFRDKKNLDPFFFSLQIFRHLLFFKRVAYDPHAPFGSYTSLGIPKIGSRTYYDVIVTNCKRIVHISTEKHMNKINTSTT